MKEPLISIITPCYNAEKFISLAIESVLAQTYKNWELIIVDDCSKDSSVAIVQKYSNIDKRIKYCVLPQNTGAPSEPRNRGIELAQGDYIALLDADDIWKPSKLADQLDCMERTNSSIVYSNGDMINSNGDVIKVMKKRESADYILTLYRCELSCSSTIFKKEILGTLKFEPMPKEDFVFWLRLLKQSGATAVNTNIDHYSYRILDNSRSRNKVEMVKIQWRIYRNIIGLDCFSAIRYLLLYLYESFKKYY